MIALFNTVSAADIALLDRIYGKRMISARMVGMSNILSVASLLIFVGAGLGRQSTASHPFQLHPNPLIVGLVFVFFAVPPLFTESSIAIVPTLLPITVCVLFLLASLTNLDPDARWSRPMALALLVSLLSDVATTVLVRKNIRWLSEETRNSRIAMAVGLQVLWLVVLIVPPGIVGYL